MVKNLLFSVISTVSVMSLSAAEITYTSIAPAPGVQYEIGTPLIEYGVVPTPNPACTEPATISLDGEVISEVYAGTNKVQIRVMQSDTSIRLVFTTKRYTDPGKYTVKVPAGFCTFNDGADISAATEFEYIIPRNPDMTIVPAEGYANEIPREFKLTFDGVREIILHECSTDADGIGVLAIYSPEDTYYPAMRVEGNVLTMVAIDPAGEGSGTFNELPEDYDVSQLVPFKDPGKYTLAIYPQNLTLVLDDGTEFVPAPINFNWYIANVPYPELTPAPGVVKELTELIISLPGDDTFGMFMGAPGVYAVKENGELGDRVSATQRPTGVVRGSKSVTYTLNAPVTEPGKYAVKISKSSFSVQGSGQSMADDTFNSIDFVFYYEVDPEGGTLDVQGVGVDAAGFTVWTASGILVGRNLDTAQFDRLPKGLYIVNGKKIIK